MRLILAYLLSFFVVAGVSAQRTKRFSPTPTQIKEQAIALESAKALQRYMNGEKVDLPLTTWNKKFNIKNLPGYRGNGYRQVTLLRGWQDSLLLEPTSQRKCQLITGGLAQFPNSRWDAAVHITLAGGKIEMIGSWDGEEPDQKALPGHKAKKRFSTTRKTRVVIF